jgi:hypothetical protein
MITGLFTQAMSASDFSENIYVADAFARVRLHARRTGARSEQLDLSLGHEGPLPPRAPCSGRDRCASGTPRDGAGCSCIQSGGQSPIRLVRPGRQQLTNPGHVGAPGRSAFLKPLWIATNRQRQHWTEITVLVRPGVIVAEAMTGALGRVIITLPRLSDATTIKALGSRYFERVPSP